jgi:Tfp pilus assembly protein PilO
MNKSLLGIFFIVIAVILGFVMVRPKIADVRDTTLERDVRLKIATAKQQRHDGLQSLTKTFAGNTDKINKYLSTLPQEPEIPEVLVTLEAMARDNSVSVESIAPLSDTKKQTVSVAMSGEADLTSIERFMQAVADNDRPLSVTALSLTKKQEGNSLAYSLNVSFPYIPATPKVAATPSTTDTTGGQ